MDRESYLSSSDVGVAFHTNFPKNFGDVMVGVYNGETYSRPEANDQKAFQIRGTLRPLANERAPAWASVYRVLRRRSLREEWRARAFPGLSHVRAPISECGVSVGRDHGSDFCSHRHEGRGGGVVVLGHAPDHKRLRGADSLRPPRTGRHDGPETRPGDLGIAYWLPHQGTVSAAFLLDYEQVKNKNFAVPIPRQERIFLHALVNF